VTAIEVETELDEAVSFRGGARTVVVRVRYRAEGTRRWTRFLIVPEEGQTIADCVDHARDAALAHMQLWNARG
jgi:2-keto-3-deoxy-L-rhamnonate aldolase RhmA